MSIAPHLAHDFFATGRLKTGEAVHLPVRYEDYPEEDCWLIERSADESDDMNKIEDTGVAGIYAKPSAEYEREGYIVLHKVLYGWFKAGQKSRQGAISRVILRPISASSAEGQSAEDRAERAGVPRRPHAFTDDGAEYEIMYLVFAGEEVKYCPFHHELARQEIQNREAWDAPSCLGQQRCS